MKCERFEGRVKVTRDFAYWKKDRVARAHRWARWIKSLDVSHRGGCARGVRSHEIGICAGKPDEKEGKGRKVVSIRVRVTKIVVNQAYIASQNR